MTVATSLFDRVLVVSTTPGTGSYTLGAAVTSAFFDATAIADNTIVYYSVQEVDGNGNPTTGCEVGVGTVSSTGTALSRETILRSSNSNNAVSWSGGTRHIMITPPAVALEAAVNATYDTGRVYVTGNGSTTDTMTASQFTKVSATLATVVANGKSWWDAANKKFLPTKAGVFHFDATVNIASTAGAANTVLALYLNGSEKIRGGNHESSVGGTIGGHVSGDILLNGSTDYVELFSFLTDGAATNRATVAVATMSWFQARFVCAA